MGRDIRIQIIGDASSFSRELGKASKSAGGFGSKLGSVSRTAGLAFAAIGGAAVAGLGSSIKAAVDFDREMRNVNSIAKLGEEDFKALEKSVTGMAAEVGQKPKVLAAGLYDIVSSGFSASDAVKILAVSAKAATAGLTDTATASKAVDAALNAYHMGADKARQVSDILFQTVNKGVLTFEELSNVMGDLVPASAPLGISLEEVGASMATLTLQGVKADEAATRVKSAMLSLAAPSKGLTEILKEHGYASGAAAVETLGFAGVLSLLSESTKGSVTETAKLEPNIRALLGVVGLTGDNLKTYNANLDAMKTAQQGAGVTAQVFAEQSKSVGVEWQKVSAQIDVFKVQIGTVLLPVVSQAIDALSRLIVWSQANWPRFKDAAVDAWESVREAADRVIAWYDGNLKPAINASITAITAIWNRFGDDITRIIRVALTTAQTMITNMMHTIQGVIKVVTGLISGDWSRAWDGVKEIVRATLGSMEALIRGAGTIFLTAATALGKAILDGVVAGFEGLIGKIEEMGRSIGVALIGFAFQAFGWAYGIGTAIVKGIGAGMDSLKDWLVGKAKDIALAPYNAMKFVLRIGSPSKVFADGIGEPIGQGIVEGFGVGVASLPEDMRKLIANAIEAARAQVEASRASLSEAWSGLASDATSAFEAIASAVKTPAEKALAGLTPSEKKLAAFDTKEATAQARRDMEAAVDDYAAALKDKTASDEQRKQALQRILDLQNQAERTALADRATAERTALEAMANEERKQANARITYMQGHFATALENLQESLAKGHTSYKEAQDKILGLFKSYHIDFEDAGGLLGVYFVKGLKEALEKAADKAGALKTLVANVAGGIKLENVPKLDTGGTVAQTGLAVVHRGETYSGVGASRSGGGNVVNVYLPNYHGDKREIVQMIENALTRKTRRGDILGFAT